MAQHVQDSSVFERRLRPIYDSLEVGNNKKALQEVEKLLKKTPALPCARALKALALVRLGREDESNEILKTISEEKHFDDATLQVLTFCYKEMEQLDKICELYKQAVKNSPANEELLAHLFVSYVRLDDYKSQQATALQLYKLVPKNPYYFWAVMSVVLQGLRGPESTIPAKRNLYLALAQRMVDKLIAENKLDAEQEVQLYLSILKEQGKYREALEFLDGIVCSKLYPGAPPALRIELMKYLGMWEELNGYLQELLKKERDRWDFYKEYIASCFELSKTMGAEAEKEATDSIFDSCHDFLCQLIESGKRVRGPYLARLQLHKKMREENLPAKELLGDFTELIIEYYRYFGDKQCCTNDIALFVCSIDREERLKLATSLVRESGVSSTASPQSKEQMQKHICSMQISRICGSNQELDAEHLQALCTALRLHYEHGLCAFGKNLLTTDLGPSDAYSLLTTHILYDVAIKTSESKHLLEAIYLLYYVLQNSPSNFHAKLLLVKIYHFLGCGIGGQSIYESLDIKHVQLDSMGYLHCSLLPTIGTFSIARTVYDHTLSFFTSSYKDRLEYIAMAYKFGSFSKLEEFMDFRDRLSNSLHYAAISAEQLLLELVSLSGTVSQNMNTFKMMSIHPAEDRIKWNELADNRDDSVVVRWDPNESIDHDEKRVSFEQDIECLRLRSHLLRFVASFIDAFQDRSHLENSVKENAANETRSIVELLKSSWDENFRRIRSENYRKSSNQFLVNLLPSRLHLMLDMPYENFFGDLAPIVVNLNGNFELTEQQATQLNNNVTKVRTILCDCIKEHNESTDGIWSRRNFQEKIVASIEILALYSLVLSICYDKFATTNIQVKKVKKKEGTHRTISENVQQRILSLMRHLKQELKTCDNELDVWKRPELHVSLVDSMTGMSINPSAEQQITTTVSCIFHDNHQQTVSELKEIIRDKIRMVNK